MIFLNLPKLLKVFTLIIAVILVAINIHLVAPDTVQTETITIKGDIVEGEHTEYIIDSPKEDIEKRTTAKDALTNETKGEVVPAITEIDPPYRLTEEERYEVEQSVMAEAGAESGLGQRAVAQAILDGTLRSGNDVISSINSYKIVRRYNKRATKSVQDAVAAVFDKGERVTEEKIDLWYAPGLCDSRWHEKQQYVTTIGNHKFFWMNGE